MDVVLSWLLVPMVAAPGALLRALLHVLGVFFIFGAGDRVFLRLARLVYIFGFCQFGLLANLLSGVRFLGGERACQLLLPEFVVRLLVELLKDRIQGQVLHADDHEGLLALLISIMVLSPWNRKGGIFLKLIFIIRVIILGAED